MANDALNILNTYRKELKKTKVLAWTACICSVVIALGSVALSYRYAETQKSDQLYILDQGSVLEATRAENNAQKDLEIIDHVTRFHELLFNVAPNTETINRNNALAFNLSDKSAYEFVNRLQEQNYYLSLIQNNAVQQVTVDSVKIDMNVYPYRAKAYLSRYYMRPSTITKYSMQTSCQLEEVGRSRTNPHGLLVEKFAIQSDTEVETRNRK